MIARFISELRGRDTLAGQLFRFGLMTAMSATISVGMPVLLHEVFGVAPRIAVAIAFLSAFVVSFATTRSLVFASNGTIRRDFFIFAGSTAAFRVSEYLAFLLLMDTLGLHYVAALVVALVVSSVVKFFWYRYTFGAAATRNS